MTKIMTKIKKALFLTYNLKLWISIFVVGLLVIFVSLILAFYEYINRVMIFLGTRINRLFSFDSTSSSIIASIIFIVGAIVIIYSAYKIWKFFANYNNELYENVYLESKLSKGKKILTIGGGTGQYTILNGIKEHTSNITAIVSTMDSGGSSQILKTEFGVLPPGDLRNSIIALSSLNEKQKRIFTLRFDKKSSLQGHPIGNLILARLDQDLGLKEAIKEFSDLLRIRGKVLPVTFDKCELIAKTKDKMIIGEENIGKKALGIKEIGLSNEVKLNPEIKEEIKKADIIVLGPGDLFTSILPNLLVKGLKEEINKSKAKKVYVCNLVTTYPDTHTFKVENFTAWIEKYITLDYILINTKKPNNEQNKTLIKDKSFFVEYLGESKRYIKTDLMSNNPKRHDSKKLANEIIKL